MDLESFYIKNDWVCAMVAFDKVYMLVQEHDMV